jgi:hypothetical protein
MVTRRCSVRLGNDARAILYVLLTKKGNKKSNLNNSCLLKSLKNNAYILWKNDLFCMREEMNLWIIFALISLLGFVLTFDACTYSAEDHWSWHCASQGLEAKIRVDVFTAQDQTQRYKYWTYPLPLNLGKSKSGTNKVIKSTTKLIIRRPPITGRLWVSAQIIQPQFFSLKNFYDRPIKSN